jgi:hypothetical protein
MKITQVSETVALEILARTPDHYVIMLGDLILGHGLRQEDGTVLVRGSGDVADWSSVSYYLPGAARRLFTEY